MYSVVTTLNLHDLKVIVREANFKAYKTFNKVLFFAQQTEMFYENVKHFIQCHTNLSACQITTLNITELLILLLEIRALSLGNTINIMVDNTKEVASHSNEQNALHEPTFTTYNKSAYKLQKDLLNVLNEEYVTFDEFKIKLKSPTLLECGSNTLFTHHFVDWIEYKGEQTIFNGNNKKEMFENLPFLIHDTLLLKINNYIKLFENISLVDITSFDNKTKDVKIKFSYNYDFLVHVIKLMFSNNLMTLHENTYRMSQFAHIDLNYLDNCTPGEVFLYMKLLESDINEKNKSQKE